VFVGNMPLTFRPNVSVLFSRVKKPKRVMPEFISTLVTSETKKSVSVVRPTNCVMQGTEITAI
jgi:hypothetical protein